MQRREFLAMPALLLAARSTDARIDHLSTTFEDFTYRTPYKFGGKEVDHVTVLNVRCRLSLKTGKTAEGFDGLLAVSHATASSPCGLNVRAMYCDRGKGILAIMALAILRCVDLLP